MIREEELIRQITKILGWDSFDEKAFMETVDSVVVSRNGIEVKMKQNEYKDNTPAVKCAYTEMMQHCV